MIKANKICVKLKRRSNLLIRLYKINTCAGTKYEKEGWMIEFSHRELFNTNTIYFDNEREACVIYNSL